MRVNEYNFKNFKWAFDILYKIVKSISLNSFVNIFYLLLQTRLAYLVKKYKYLLDIIMHHRVILVRKFLAWPKNLYAGMNWCFGLSKSFDNSEKCTIY